MCYQKSAGLGEQAEARRLYGYFFSAWYRIMGLIKKYRHAAKLAESIPTLLSMHTRWFPLIATTGSSDK